MNSTKETIIQKCLVLFAAKGFDGTSVRDIAAEVGIKESSIYAHFKNKDAILVEIFERYGPSDVAKWAEKINYERLVQDPRRELKEFVRKMTTSWLKPEERLFNRILMVEGCFSTKYKHVDPLVYIKKPKPALSKVFDFLKEKEIIKNIPTAFLMFEFMAPLIHLREQFLLFREDDAQDDEFNIQVDRHVDFFFSAISQGKEAMKF